jgi:hypothetical protein
MRSKLGIVMLSHLRRGFHISIAMPQAPMQKQPHILHAQRMTVHFGSRAALGWALGSWTPYIQSSKRVVVFNDSSNTHDPQYCSGRCLE